MKNKSYYIKSWRKKRYKYILFIETTSYSTGFYLKVHKNCKHFYLCCLLNNNKEQKIDIKDYKNVINSLKNNVPRNVVGIVNKANK
jgi:hypothetical protein